MRSLIADIDPSTPTSRIGKPERIRAPLPPIACVVSFIDGINRGDVDRLASLMADDHRLHVLDETPLDGKEANIEAWRGYTASFPEYVIYPHRIIGRGVDEVAVLGHTTGSHLDLRDEDERELTLIWRAVVSGGLLSLWEIIEDTPARRSELGLALACNAHLSPARSRRRGVMYCRLSLGRPSFSLRW